MLALKKNYDPTLRPRRQAVSLSRQLRRQWILSGATGAVLAQLSGPMVWAILALFIGDIAELYLASRFGANELAALSFTLPVQAGLNALGIAPGIVVSSNLAVALGRNDFTDVQRLLFSGFIVSILLGVLIALLGLFSFQWLFASLGLSAFSIADTGDMLMRIEPYMHYRYASFVLYLMTMVVFGCLRAFGSMWQAAAVLVAMSGLQVLLSALFIYTDVIGQLFFSNLEKLGLAHFIAALSSSVMGLVFVLRVEKINVVLMLKCRNVWRCALSHLKLLVSVGAMQLMAPIALALIMLLVSKFGFAAVAAYGVVVRLEPLALLLPMILTTSLPIFIGQNWGAGRVERVRLGLKCALFTCVVWQLMVAVVFYMAADPIAAIFCKQAAVTQSITRALTLLPISYVGVAVAMLYASSCNAVQLPRMALSLYAIRLFVLSLPAALIGAYLAGFVGLLLGLSGANILLGLVFVFSPRARLVEYFNAQHSCAV